MFGHCKYRQITAHMSRIIKATQSRLVCYCIKLAVEATFEPTKLLHFPNAATFLLFTLIFRKWFSLQYYFSVSLTCIHKRGSYFSKNYLFIYYYS